mmetsp:Transcript_16593/g.29947  ORF Transcript_16593/g.29947 Transcript_16593/m.29947 type:complete len:578 (+) Transcript_16593:299-2032(+)
MPSVMSPSSFGRVSLLARLLLLGLVPTTALANLFGDGDGEVSIASSPTSPLGGKDERIINGDEAQANRYPYSVTLQDSRGHFCGGSLIGNDVVLTAAHCMRGSLFSVRIGSDDVDKGELVGARRVVKHPNYSSSTDEYDMALVFLKESISFDIPLVRVNDESSYPSKGTTVVAMGWGDMDSGDNQRLPDNLREVDLEVITNKQCENYKIDGDSYKGWIYDSMLCTYTKGKDACQGDSGGPLVVRTNDNPEDDVQVGIVSWGVGCASLPGVFSRISEAYEWTVDTVCDEGNGSKDPPPSLCGPQPTLEPTPEPTPEPTKKPTRNPTRRPTRRPTKKPTRQPSKKPTRQPTSSPTTSAPTFSPTDQPTDMPSTSSAPTSSPSASPTQSAEPTLQPTDSPSISEAPSIAPSASPSISSQPSSQPSSHPTSEPSAQPSGQPSAQPSSQPSSRPSVQPSLEPSFSSRPTGRPSQQPSQNPSSDPSQYPTISKSPSLQPSMAPSFGPSYSPTATTSPTMSSIPTLSVPPTAEPESEQSIPTDTLLVSDASVLVEKTEKSSAATVRGFAVGTLLCCIISALLAF